MRRQGRDTSKVSRCGSGVASVPTDPGSGAERQPKTNLVHFRRHTTLLVEGYSNSFCIVIL